MEMKFEGVSKEQHIKEKLKPGEKIEVEISPRVWVRASVANDGGSRVALNLDTPVLVFKTIETICSRCSAVSEPVLKQESYYLTQFTQTRRSIRRPIA